MAYGFEYYCPTKVVFGKGAEAKTGEQVRKHGGKKVLLHYSCVSAEHSGLLDRIRKSLKENDVSYIELGSVAPNPHLSLVYEGIRLCRDENANFLLAIGGGSTIDSAKAIAYGLANEGDALDFYAHTRTAACLPLGVVLTIAASGSEMRPGSVITKETTYKKCAYHDDLSRPQFAIMNPEFTIPQPAYQTACGCVDILMHTQEHYFTNGGNMGLTDNIAEGLMRTVMKNAKLLKQYPTNYAARAEIMWASSLSHNGLTGCGNDGGDFVTHMLAHEVSGMFNVAHGAALAAIWGSWARYVYKNCLPRFKRFALYVMDVENKGTDEEIALRGIEAMELFYHSIDMPISLTEIEPTEAQIHKIACSCALAVGGHKGSAKILNKNDMVSIYQNAL